MSKVYETEGWLHDAGAKTNQTKTGKTLSFYKRDFVVKVDNSYQDKEVFNYAQFTMFGDNADKLNGINNGDKVKVSWVMSGNLSSSGVWNNLKAINVDVLEVNAQAKPAPKSNSVQPPAMPDDDTGLPF